MPYRERSIKVSREEAKRNATQVNSNHHGRGCSSAVERARLDHTESGDEACVCFSHA